MGLFTIVDRFHDTVQRSMELSAGITMNRRMLVSKSMHLLWDETDNFFSCVGASL
jgi:hypothetical protein